MRYAILVLLTGPFLALAQTPKATGVSNGASFSGSLCPGMLASLFGSNLATGTTAAQSLPLPTNLLGTQVLVQDPSMPNPLIAPLYFVSPGQINFQIPFEVVRTNISVSVSTPQGTSAAVNINLGPMAPGMFSKTADGTGTTLAFDSGFKPLMTTPSLGSTIIFYATGLGATTPPATSGAGGNSSPPLNLVASPFDVYVGGNKATVAWAGLAPGFAGVYQLNVVPSGEAVGDVVIVCATCSESNHVKMPQAPLSNGNNTANVTGSVTILYPAGQPAITYSPPFVVATVTAHFSVKPSAGKFTLSVLATIGSVTVDGTTIQFDPALGWFDADVPSPTSFVRGGMFANSGITAIDFNCGTSTGCAFPANIVPMSFWAPTLLPALQSVSLPNSAPNGVHSFYGIGEAMTGSTFTMGGGTNADLTTFASFASIPYPTSDVPVSVSLYIDGQLIDAATTTYKPPQTPTTLTSSANPSSVGQAVTFTATVSPSTATGTVTFFDGSTTLGTRTLNRGAATFTTSNLSLGTHSIVATYSGDGAFGLSSVTWSQLVRASTTTTVTSSANPSISGQSVMLTASVSPLGATGTVTFLDGSTTLGTGMLNSGTATFTTSRLSAGNHSFVASYSGDSTYGSSSGALSQLVTVTASVTLVSSATLATLGQTVTLDATITPCCMPTGTVAFLDGTTVLGSSMPQAKGGALHAILSTSSLSLGNHSITARYSGDATYVGSTSPTVTLTVWSISMTSSPNPSALGQTVTFSVCNIPNGVSGRLDFTDNSTWFEGNPFVGSPCSTGKHGSLSVGTHKITATYSDIYGGNTSATVTQVVNVH